MQPYYDMLGSVTMCPGMKPRHDLIFKFAALSAFRPQMHKSAQLQLL